MRVAFVYNEVPNREHSTDTNHAFLLLEALAGAGHEVLCVLLLSDKSIISDDATRGRWLEELKGLDVDVRVMPVGRPTRANFAHGMGRKQLIKTLLRPDVADWFPYVELAPQVEEFLKPISPDAIFLWGNWPPIAATHGLNVAPRFAFVGDPPHVPASFRSQPPFAPKKPIFSKTLWHFKLRMFLLARMTVRLLSQCQSVAACAAHHAEWFRQHGLPTCKYLQSIVPDWGGQDWEERRRQQPHNDRFKIILVGHLLTTANYSGIHLFANETLPVLERELGSSFEVHICGKGELPAELRSKLDRPSVHLRGFVDDIVSELFSSDVFLVPTPIKQGIRMRIPYAWSVGSCVIAHQVNAFGLPELKHGGNALLASTGEGIARDIIRAFKDEGLRRQIGLEGHRTYDAHFSYGVASSKILRELEAIVWE